MYARQDLEEVPYDLDKPRITVWIVHQNAVYWCNVKLAKRKKDCSSIKLHRTQSFIFNTLLAICVEKVENMKTGED